MCATSALRCTALHLLIVWQMSILHAKDASWVILQRVPGRQRVQSAMLGEGAARDAAGHDSSTQKEHNFERVQRRCSQRLPDLRPSARSGGEVPVREQQGRHQGPAVEAHGDPLACHLDPHARPPHVDQVLQKQGRSGRQARRCQISRSATQSLEAFGRRRAARGPQARLSSWPGRGGGRAGCGAGVAAHLGFPSLRAPASHEHGDVHGGQGKHQVELRGRGGATKSAGGVGSRPRGGSSPAVAQGVRAPGAGVAGSCGAKVQAHIHSPPPAVRK